MSILTIVFFKSSIWVFTSTGRRSHQPKKLLNLDQNRLTENLASTPNISQLINSVELFIFIPRVVDNREGIRWLKKKFSGKTHTEIQINSTHRVLPGGKCLVELKWGTGPGPELAISVKVFPRERVIWPWRYTKCCGHDRPNL